MAGVPAPRPKPEHLLLKWAGTVLEKSEDEWTDVDAFRDGRLLLELLDRLWLGGSSSNQTDSDTILEADIPGSKVDTIFQDEGGGFQGGVRISREAQPELTLCVSPKTLAAKGKAAGVNLDVSTLEKVKEGDGAALHETLLSMYRPWIMQNGQKGVRRVSKGQVSETAKVKKTAIGDESVEASSGASEGGSGLKVTGSEKEDETQAGAGENSLGGSQGQSKLVARGKEKVGAGAANNQKDSERAPEALEGAQKDAPMARKEEERAENAVVAARAETLRGGAISADIPPGAASVASAAGEPSQPGKRARANVLKQLNTKARAGLVAGHIEKIASPTSAGEFVGRAGDRIQSGVSPALVESDGVQAADLVREGADATSEEEKQDVAVTTKGSPANPEVKDAESDGGSSSSLSVQDKKVILSDSAKSETLSGSATTGSAKQTRFEKAAEPDRNGDSGDGAKWRAPLPPRSAYSASDGQLMSARAWLADIIAGVSADVSERPSPPEFESGVAHVRACELLLDTNSDSELRRFGVDEPVSMTERRVTFVYEQLRSHGARVSNLRRRKRSSGGAIDGEKLGAEAEIELAETLMSAAAELGLSVPRAVERIRELTGVKEHPYDWEDALQLWVNAVLADHHSRTPVKDAKADEGLLCIDDLLVDLSDGRALAVLLHSLSPTLIDPRGIPLDRQLSRSETAHVIGLIQHAARTIRVPFPLTPADLIYGHAGVKPALLYFLAAIFRTFEQKEPLLPVVRKVPSSKGAKTGSEPGAVRSGETISAGPPDWIPEPRKTESPHRRGSSEIPDPRWEIEAPAVSSSSGRPESGRSQLGGRYLSFGRPASKESTSPTADIPVETVDSARSTQDSMSAETPSGGVKDGSRRRSSSVEKRAGSASPGSQDVGETPAKQNPLGSRTTSTRSSRTTSAKPSRLTSPDSSRLTSARSSGRLAVSPTMISSGGVANLESDFQPGADVTGFVSALPSASMTSEDARAVRQANLWALLNRAEANAATAAASLSLVRERLSEELSARTGPERNPNGSPTRTQMVKSGVGRGSKEKSGSARMSAEVGMVGRAEGAVARASSAPVPLAEFRFEGGLEDEDMVRIGEPSAVELGSEPSGTRMGGLEMADRENLANASEMSSGQLGSMNARSSGEGKTDVRTRTKKFSLRTHPLERFEAVGSDRLETVGGAAAGERGADEAETETTAEWTKAERAGANTGSLSSSQIKEKSDAWARESRAKESADLPRLSLESPRGSVFRVLDALKSASSPVETRSLSKVGVPRLDLPGEFTSPVSLSPRTERSSGRSTGLKSYRTRGSRVLTERSVEARRSLEVQFRLLEEQKAESDRKRNEGSEVRKSLEERRAALVRRSQEGVAGFAGGLGGLVSGNESFATGSGGLVSGGGSILRVLSERLSRSTEGSEGDVAEARSDVSGVMTSEAADRKSDGNGATSYVGSIELAVSEGRGSSRAKSEARSEDASNENDRKSDKRRTPELPRGILDDAARGLDVRASTESVSEARASEQGSVPPLNVPAGPLRLSAGPPIDSAELRGNPSNPMSVRESSSRPADALRTSVETERKEIDWGSLDSDSPVRRTEFPSDSESSGRLGGGAGAERNPFQEKKAVDWGTLLTGDGLDLSSDVSRLDDSMESRGGAGTEPDSAGVEPDSAEAVRNGEGSEEQGGSSLWGDEGHVSKWDRRWSPESMHADVMHLEAEEKEERGGGEGLWKELDNGLSSHEDEKEKENENKNENENEAEPSLLPERHLRKPPKPVALHLIDRDDSEKRARMQRALDEKRAHFLLERQLQQAAAAAASSRRPTDDSSQNPETLLVSDVPSGKRRSSGSSAEGDGGHPAEGDGGLPAKGGGGSRSKGNSGSSAHVSRRGSGVLDGPADGGSSGKPSRRVSGLSEDSEDKAGRKLSGVSPFYAAPPRMSNKKLVRNALSTVCLAGGALKLERERALMALDAFDGDNFVILFKDDKGTKFKGLYVLSADGKEIDRIYGSGPESLRSDGVAHYLKYDSGAKEFKPLQTQQFTTSTCAVAPSNRAPGKRLSR
ncbi:hypothetical protein KFL_000770250 [Klebsormidium nitens]|uniref:Calponin-homology (CH) domain-containing protein n=1 Tax=Klebsormidium nitens TaxID=105231 RepID=A0A1Y1HU19_KLENI|nr:hypothetical protein KFL_000770250 [Klebsormidium nitens]|eukprot:GAQ81332.1 hypothetical protein KFL_000770250 [Klebsormidium nitens]